MTVFARVSATGWEQGSDTSSFARVSATGWEQEDVPVTGGITGTSVGVWTFTGSAAGTVAQPPVNPVNGSSVATWILSGTAAAAFEQPPPTEPVEGASAGEWTFTGSASGTIAQPAAQPVNGSSVGVWTLSGAASAQIQRPPNTLLPPGWVVTKVLEDVPNPNFGSTVFGNTYFTRWTYICTDENNQFVCASGGESDCYNQAQAMAEQRTQRLPYNEAI